VTMHLTVSTSSTLKHLAQHGAAADVVSRCRLGLRHDGALPRRSRSNPGLLLQTTRCVGQSPIAVGLIPQLTTLSREPLHCRSIKKFAASSAGALFRLV